MRPTPIPDTEVWEDHERRVIAGPTGDLTDTDIAPVEALVGAQSFSMRLGLEDGDLATLAAGGVLWLTILGDRLQPFSVVVTPAEVPRTPVLSVVVTPREGQAPRFDARVDGVAHDEATTFVRGCIEALEQMLAEVPDTDPPNL